MEVTYCTFFDPLFKEAFGGGNFTKISSSKSLTALNTSPP